MIRMVCSLQDVDRGALAAHEGGGSVWARRWEGCRYVRRVLLHLGDVCRLGRERRRRRRRGGRRVRRGEGQWSGPGGSLGEVGLFTDDLHEPRDGGAGRRRWHGVQPRGSPCTGRGAGGAAGGGRSALRDGERGGGAGGEGRKVGRRLWRPFFSVRHRCGFASERVNVRAPAFCCHRSKTGVLQYGLPFTPLGHSCKPSCFRPDPLWAGGRAPRAATASRACVSPGVLAAPPLHRSVPRARRSVPLPAGARHLATPLAGLRVSRLPAPRLVSPHLPGPASLAITYRRATPRSSDAPNLSLGSAVRFPSAAVNHGGTCSVCNILLQS